MSAPIHGHVYFANCYAMDGYDLKVVKIGCANDPQQRVKSVQTGQPFTCRLAASFEGSLFHEYFIHMWLRDHKISGEFFHRRGPVADLIEHVKKHRSHPFAIRSTGPEGSFATLDVVEFMDRRGITLQDVKREAGVTCAGYENLLKKNRSGNRRFLAALSVAAIRKGISIDWPRDFRMGVEPDREAA